ncbi:esterase [Drechmeria coniospora]|uniref:Esterase n=1 Tax=Drechmeria coniospora TaxID=98403 RepID=A0A151GAH8_DRECN|nr:esterase [Drechmeria coniospora]KYK54087.1 esterase [Drechmeria coniospora]
MKFFICLAALGLATATPLADAKIEKQSTTSNLTLPQLRARLALCLERNPPTDGPVLSDFAASRASEYQTEAQLLGAVEECEDTPSPSLCFSVHAATDIAQDANADGKLGRTIPASPVRRARHRHRHPAASLGGRGDTWLLRLASSSRIPPDGIGSSPFPGNGERASDTGNMASGKGEMASDKGEMASNKGEMASSSMTPNDGDMASAKGGTASAGHEGLQPLHPSMAGKLDPVFEKLYNDHVASTPARPLDLGRLRSTYSTLYSYGTGPAPDVGRVYDAKMPVDGEPDVELDVRVYEPATEGPWPVHLDFHGGGWAVGDLETEAHICRHICRHANVVVVDVAYRLVPEFAFPTAVADGYAALRYVQKHGFTAFNVMSGSISLGGVSAGGFIALALAHFARDDNISLRLVAVGTPVIDDLSRHPSAAASPYPSMRENEFAPTLNWKRLAWFDELRRSTSLPDDASDGWLVSLLDAPRFEGLCRTVIFTAGADPLRDEGEHYGRLLAEHGVEVTLQRFRGMPHPFMHMDKDLWQAREFIEKTARAIRLAHWE